MKTSFKIACFSFVLIAVALVYWVSSSGLEGVQPTTKTLTASPDSAWEAMTPAQRKAEADAKFKRDQDAFERERAISQTQELLNNGVAELKARMKDPDSFEVIDSFQSPQQTLVACVEYKAKNSFGAYTRNMAVITMSGIIDGESDPRKLARVWIKSCGGRA